MRFCLLLFLAFYGLVSKVTSESEPEDPDSDSESYLRCENSETGERYREAQTWTEDEGCTECICEKSGPACSTVDCLEPDCEEGYVIGTKPGKCCPGCIKKECYFKGEQYNEGGEWSPDPCTHCNCVADEDGVLSEMCAVMSCAFPEGCPETAFTRPGECCPTCPEPCEDRTTGKKYDKGDSWSPDPCTSCTCSVLDSGEKESVCAVVGCAKPYFCPYDLVTPDGQCCPICPCTDPDTDETREVGEEFQADPCTTCRCTESGAQCDMIMCDIPDCEGIGEGWRLFTRPDQCCPGCVGPCTDRSGTELNIGDSWKMDDCTDCECIDDGRGGKSEICAAQDCPDIDCQTEIVKVPGQCCPVCRKPCTNPETDEVYEAGSEWQVDDCKSCVCKTDAAGQLVETCKNSCEEPPPDPDVCATVRCADPDCEYGYPVKIDGECCPVCPPEECAMVDCMPVHPNCESVYTRDNLCCPVCKDPPECPQGESMAECFSDPCQGAKCSNYPTAECRASNCGDCYAVFYDGNGDVITSCDGSCPGGQEFKECGMACDRTCSDPIPMCTKNCVQRCECPQSAPILYKQTCMPENECPDYLPFCDEIYPDDTATSDETASSGSSGSAAAEGVSSDSVSSAEVAEDTDRKRRSMEVEPEPAPPCPEPLDCPKDMCEKAKCPNFPYAKCRVEVCGMCEAVFYHDTGVPIESCEGDCPKSMKYNECGSACTATCTEQSQPCIEMCVPRCECPRDAPILLGNSCVPANECPDTGDSDGDGGSDGGDDGGSDGGDVRKPCRSRYPEPMPPEEKKPKCDKEIVNCLVDPCSVATCPNYPQANCRANYCGGCNAEFYDASGALISDCEGECGFPKQYTDCGSACPQTCYSHADTCISVCVPGCACPSKTPVLYGGKCITRDQCPADEMFDFDGAEASESGAVSSDDAEDADSLDKWGEVRDSGSLSMFSFALNLSILTTVRAIFL